MSPSSKTYDLEARTLFFAKRVRDFVHAVPRNVANATYVKQLIRSSSSIGANYCEANACLGKRDFCMKVRTSRKEAKESVFWLELIDVGEIAALEGERRALIQEARELMWIFGAILKNSH